MAQLLIRINPDDGVITVRVDRQVEHISTLYKTKSQIFDAVKYACISKGATISDIELTDTLNKIGVS